MNKSEELAYFRLKVHTELIRALKQAYSTDKWKYAFMKSLQEKYDIKVQYSQLNSFEEGGARSENIVNLILMELLRFGNYSIAVKRKDVEVSLSVER